MFNAEIAELCWWLRLIILQGGWSTGRNGQSEMFDLIGLCCGKGVMEMQISAEHTQRSQAAMLLHQIKKFCYHPVEWEQSNNLLLNHMKQGFHSVVHRARHVLHKEVQVFTEVFFSSITWCKMVLWPLLSSTLVHHLLKKRESRNWCYRLKRALKQKTQFSLSFVLLYTTHVKAEANCALVSSNEMVVFCCSADTYSHSASPSRLWMWLKPLHASAGPPPPSASQPWIWAGVCMEAFPYPRLTFKTTEHQRTNQWASFQTVGIQSSLTLHTQRAEM